MHFLEIIQIIKDRRESLKVTQETLAQLSGIGLRTLKQLESGKGNPTLATLIKICDVLGIEIYLGIKHITIK